MPLTIVTHSLDNCMALAEHNKVRVKVLSGTLNHENRYFYSNLAIEELQNVVFDTAFIAASGSTKMVLIYLIKMMLRSLEWRSNGRVKSFW